MFKRKSFLFGFMLFLIVSVLTISGCGGGGGGSNNRGGGYGGSFDGPVTAEDYLGTWSCQDTKCKYSVTFTVGERSKEQDGNHSGSVECGIFGTVNINGDNTDPSDPSVINVLIEPHGHSISIIASKNIAFDHTATVQLSGQLTDPNRISVDALHIWESGGENFSYVYSSSEEPLLFTKQ